MAARVLQPAGPPKSVTTPPEPQPQLEIKKLAPGETAAVRGGVVRRVHARRKSKLFRHYLDTTERSPGGSRFNISGLCILPDNEQNEPRPLQAARHLGNRFR